jgi:hypothetical protein
LFRVLTSRHPPPIPDGLKLDHYCTGREDEYARNMKMAKDKIDKTLGPP